MKLTKYGIVALALAITLLYGGCKNSAPSGPVAGLGGATVNKYVSVTSPTAFLPPRRRTASPTSSRGSFPWRGGTWGRSSSPSTATRGRPTP